MIISAVLLALGVNALVIVLVLAVLVARRRWLRRRPGEFPGAVRLTSGELEGISGRWRRGFGRWDGDVLAWTKGPLLVRNHRITINGPSLARSGRSEVKRLGDDPLIFEFATDQATIEIATPTRHGALVAHQDGVAVEINTPRGEGAER